MGDYFSQSPEPRHFGGLILGAGFIQSTRDAKPLDALDRFGKPTLVIHGTGDETVPFSSGQLFADRARGQLITVAEANHGYEHPAWRDQLYGATVDHFTQTL